MTDITRRLGLGALILGAVLAWQAPASAQSYTVATFPQGTFTPLSAGRTTLFLTGPTAFDDDSMTVTLPFTFQFFGVNQTSITVSTNGYATFGTDGTDFSPDAIPATTDPNDYIAPFWQDLIVIDTARAGVADEISHETVGTAPSRVFMIEWWSMTTVGPPPTFTVDTGSFCYFQIHLFETTNVIEFHYWSTNTNFPTVTPTATIGIENAAGTAGFGGPNTTNTNANVPAADNYRFTPGGGGPTNPDLTVPTVSITPTSGAAGSTINVTRTLMNGTAGNITAPFSYEVRFSTDATIDATDTLAFTGMVTSLAGNMSDSGTDTVTVPMGLAAGSYFVGIIADSGNVVTEANEMNNTGVAGSQFTVGSMAPDFTADTVSATPLSVAQGGTINVSRAFTNNGTANATNFTYDIRLSTDTTITTADTSLLNQNVASLNMGVQDSGSDTVTIPGGTTPGTYFIGLQLDSANAVAEANESDNTAVFTTSITVTSTGMNFPDLTVPSVSAGASTVVVGGTLPVTRELGNPGAGDASGFTYEIYLSTDNVITTADTSIFSGTPGTITAGNSNNATVTTNIPGGLTPGTYFVGVIADPSNALAEADENNNTGFDPTAITVTNSVMQADLSVASVNLSTQSVAPGGTVNVTRVLNNGGNAAAGTFTYGVYLSDDTTITLADVELLTVMPAGIAAGGNDTATVTVTIPGTTAVGTYFIGVITDTTGAVTELDENNNAGFAPLALTVTNNPVTPANNGGGKRNTGVCAMATPDAPTPWNALAVLLVLGGLTVVRRRRA